MRTSVTAILPNIKQQKLFWNEVYRTPKETPDFHLRYCYPRPISFKELSFYVARGIDLLLSLKRLVDV
jgi:hypothetical protein